MGADTTTGKAQAQALYDGDLASQSLGIELVDAGEGWARVTMRVTESMLNGHRICHGGYVFLLADTAFAMACNTRGAPAVASGGDVSFLSPVFCDDVLVASAEERALQGRSGLYDIRVSRGDDVVAELRGRSRSLRTVPQPPNGDRHARPDA
jgi:acyl-CoA thioesterase